jgi:hypothetical protein
MTIIPLFRLISLAMYSALEVGCGGGIEAVGVAGGVLISLVLG